MENKLNRKACLRLCAPFCGANLKVRLYFLPKLNQRSLFIVMMGKNKEKEERKKVKKKTDLIAGTGFELAVLRRLLVPETSPRNQGNKIQDTFDL